MEPSNDSLPITIHIQRSDEGPVKSPTTSEMSNFATPGGYRRLSDDEGEEEFTRLRQSVNHDPLVSYGAAGLLPPPPKHRRRRRGRRRRSSGSFVQQVMSAAGYEKLQEAGEELGREEESDSESEEDEGPPTIEMIYRRSCKDKTKLIVLPLLYFVVMVIAGIFAFYSIEGLITSYKHRVRTVDYVTVPNGTYQPVGIAMFLQDFATFVNCSFLYGDDLYPNRDSWTPLRPSDQFCTSINVTFYSRLINANRTAMVFRGPTLASLKQSLGIHFLVDTTKRQFSAIEYLLFSDWYAVFNRSEAEQNDYLSNEEKNKPLHTVPGGFRTWIKMNKIVFNVAGAQNVSDISITSDFSKYSDRRNDSDRTNDVVYVLFEWESTIYEFVGEILSTNIWNTLGGLAGIFVTLFRVGELCKRWIWRMRRERKKKILKLQELAEEQQRLLEEYEQKMEEKTKRKDVRGDLNA